MDFLFDIGRVLLDFDFETSLHKLFPPGTTDADARIEAMMEHKIDLETGHIDGDTFIAHAIAAAALDVSPDAFRHAWRNVFTPNPPMWRIVEKLHASGAHRLILFSNTNGIHCPWIFENFPGFGQFTAAVLSHEVGSMKPAPAIYQHAIDQFGLTPADTLYIDDLPENIATGREFGFRCHLYDLHQHAEFESWLASELNDEMPVAASL